MTSHAQDALQTEWLDRFGPDVRDPLSRGCLGRSEMIVCDRILMVAAF
jgi:hypothetical protein